MKVHEGNDKEKPERLASAPAFGSGFPFWSWRGRTVNPTMAAVGPLASATYRNFPPAPNARVLTLRPAENGDPGMGSKAAILKTWLNAEICESPAAVYRNPRALLAPMTIADGLAPVEWKQEAQEDTGVRAPLV